MKEAHGKRPQNSFVFGGCRNDAWRNPAAAD
jgi:hypothetical protein